MRRDLPLFAVPEQLFGRQVLVLLRASRHGHAGGGVPKPSGVTRSNGPPTRCSNEDDLT